MKQITRDGILTEGTDGQERFLHLLYGTIAGRLFLKFLTAPVISRIAGSFLSSKMSCVFIDSFIKKNHINMNDFENVTYGSYNEFFSRHIRLEKRPISSSNRDFISPCDSKLTVLPITDHCRFTLKNTVYTLDSLLKDPALASEYKDGYLLIFRLTVDDYHRYCYPADGTKEENISIPGILHTVNPIANDYYPIYKENSREYCILHSTNFDDMILMEVGALLVGKICNHTVSHQVCRGQEKGYFQFGGSTVVVAVKANTVQLDADLLKNSKEGIETVVRYGEKIGVAIKE